MALSRREQFLLLAAVLIGVDLGLVRFSMALPYGHVWNIATDRGYGEWWQYGKWAALCILMATTAVSRRSFLAAAWAAILIYLLLDDSQSIHETLGSIYAERLGFEPAFRLRAQDFGELLSTALAAMPLLAVLAIAYLANHDAALRRFSHVMLVLLALLAVCGIVIDMLDIAVADRKLAYRLSILEDGGEMVVASLMLAVVATSGLWQGHEAPTPITEPEPA